jgi:hypothetical protein
MDVHDNRNKTSLWRFIISKPFDCLISELFPIRPIRYIFNCYVKSAKFLIITLPRNIWLRGNVNSNILEIDNLLFPLEMN